MTEAFNIKLVGLQLLTAGVLVSLLLGWTASEKKLVEANARKEIHRTAETLFGAMKGSIQANLRRGFGHKDRIGMILKNVTETTQLNHFEIRQEHDVITSSGTTLPPDINTPEGTLFSKGDFWLWKTVELQDHTRHPYQGGQGFSGGRSDDSDIDFNEKSQLIVLGLDAAPYYEELKHARWHIHFLTGIGILALLVLFTAWSFVLRNRELSAQLGQESLRAEHLSDLQLAGAGLAHETKNPLGLIRGMAQQISTSKACPEPIRDLSIDMMEQADIATARLGEFIAFSRKSLPKEETVNLKDAAGRICDLMQYDAERRGVKLLNEIPGLSVKADPGMLSQILTNLISNALNACSKGNRICLSVQRRKQTVELLISDTGSGIPVDLLPEVFKPYVTGRDDGHGLGLAIVRRMVEDHGWRIELKSVEQQGTEVRICDIPCMSGEPSET
jgi:signal transduction histidine kinase